MVIFQIREIQLNNDNQELLCVIFYAWCLLLGFFMDKDTGLSISISSGEKL